MYIGGIHRDGEVLTHFHWLVLAPLSFSFHVCHLRHRMWSIRLLYIHKILHFRLKPMRPFGSHVHATGQSNGRSSWLSLAANKTNGEIYLNEWQSKFNVTPDAIFSKSKCSLIFISPSEIIYSSWIENQSKVPIDTIQLAAAINHKSYRLKWNVNKRSASVFMLIFHFATELLCPIAIEFYWEPLPCPTYVSL